MSGRLKVGGYRPGVASWTTAGLCLVVGLLHLFAPLIWPLASPSAESVRREAPVVGALSIVLLALLAIATWIDSNRESWPLGTALALVALNVGVRDSFNITLGAELNYVLPLVVGMAAGGPLGFLVGAASCLVSQFLLDQVSGPLATQMLVWGLAGVVGGALRPLGPRLSCLVAPVGGFAFGVGGGVLLNASGWPTDAEARPAFIPVAPFHVNLASLVRYGLDTSLGVDLLRGSATAVGLAIVGYPISRVLRHALRPPVVDESPALPDPGDPRPDALARRRRSLTARHMWETEHG